MQTFKNQDLFGKGLIKLEIHEENQNQARILVCSYSNKL